MRLLRATCLLAGACAVIARSTQHLKNTLGPKYEHVVERIDERQQQQHQAPQRRAAHQPRASKHLNDKTSPFQVDGTKIPDVHFDIGESYAGLLPISSNPDESRQLYFWYFPSSNPLAEDEITIWLNGGPGCSSLEGLLQENGPFLWQYGTFAPVPNPWTWVNLTNMVWVEQPVGTGYSQGVPDAKSEFDVAHEFMGFFKNFVDTFSLQGKKIYIAGESYAGMFVPHIAHEMLDANDTCYFNLEGTMIYDPSINSGAVTNEIPAYAFLEKWAGLFALNDTYVAHLAKQADTCGYTSFLNEYLVYPPAGPLPSPPGLNGPADGCALWEDIFNAALLVNPCWDVYQIATTCPLLWDVLGFPGTLFYQSHGSEIYFDRADVKAAINAPRNVTWQECPSIHVYNTSSGQSFEAQNNLYSGLTVLPSVIERSKRTVIGHGNIDDILLVNGTLLTIQNMTWNGMQGFQAPVTDDFYVPYHTDYQLSTLAGAGVMGKTRTERGLTFVEIYLSGHMVPQYQPSAAYRHMEFLLGRIDSLSSTAPFTNSSDRLVAQSPFPSPDDVESAKAHAKKVAGLRGEL